MYSCKGLQYASLCVQVNLQTSTELVRSRTIRKLFIPWELLWFTRRIKYIVLFEWVPDGATLLVWRVTYIMGGICRNLTHFLNDTPRSVLKYLSVRILVVCFLHVWLRSKFSIMTVCNWFRDGMLRHKLCSVWPYGYVRAFQRLAELQLRSVL
jgi:hypothetical protein